MSEDRWTRIGHTDSTDNTNMSINSLNLDDEILRRHLAIYFPPHA